MVYTVMQVLVVDDEPKICELIRYNLERYHYRVFTALDGPSGLELALRLLPDLIVLDVMLPGMDGFEVCRELRLNPETASIPVIMLTARGQETDKVLSFELGADDYVTKPFSPRELIARIKAHARRAAIAVPAVSRECEREIQRGNLVIYPDRFQVFLQGKELHLSRKEFGLLLLMASHPGQIFSRDRLMSLVWGFDGAAGTGTRTIDVHVRYLRRKIEADPSEPKYIETVRGMGYRFRHIP